MYVNIYIVGKIRGIINWYQSLGELNWLYQVSATGWSPACNNQAKGGGDRALTLSTGLTLTVRSRSLALFISQQSDVAFSAIVTFVVLIGKHV